MLAATCADDRGAERLLSRAMTLAEGVASPVARGWVMLFRTMRHYTAACWRDAWHAAREAQRWIGQHIVDSGWLLQELDMGAGTQLVMLGEFVEAAELSRLALQRGLESGNAFLADSLLCQRAYVCLVHDEPNTALADTHRILQTWRGSRCRMMGVTAIWAMLPVLLYLDRPREALNVLHRQSSWLHRAGFYEVRPLGVLLSLLKGTVALACSNGKDRARQLRSVRSAIDKLRAEPSPFGPAAADLLEAGAWRVRGERARAAALYGAAADSFDAQHVRGYAAAARIRQAELIEEDVASSVRAQAMRYFTTQGIVDPVRWTRAFAPCP